MAAETKVIVIPNGKICDYIGGKFRNDTPEEYVRQMKVNPERKQSTILPLRR